MTQDEIIEMARQAGCFEKHQVFYFTLPELEAFTKLVAEHERNEIIEILDASTGYVHMDAIRERG
jgi:hypothetical protein